MSSRWLQTCLLALSIAAPSLAADWLRFRGPNGSGSAEENDLPVELSAAGAAWTREVPFGHSSPIVSRGTIFLTALDGDTLATLAFDAVTGAERWRRSVPRQRVDSIAAESGPTVATPVADTNGVYSFFPEFGLVSYDYEGKERWRLELPPFKSYYGLASSPVIEQGVLILLCDQTLEPYIVGVDAKSGKKLWQQARDLRAESWTTPVVHRAGTDQARVVTFGTGVVDAYRPSTGEASWRLAGFGFSPIASPVVDGDVAYVVVPDQGELFSPPKIETFIPFDKDGDQALTKDEIASSDWASTFPWFDTDRDGKATLKEIAYLLEGMESQDFGLVAVDLTGPKILWRERKTLPYVASPILYRGVLFLVKDGGILTSYDPKTGAVIKRGRIQGAVEPFSPSPVGAAGRIYLTSSTGTIAVVTAKGDWKTLAVNDLDEPVFASPAIADGRLYVRTQSKLYGFARK